VDAIRRTGEVELVTRGLLRIQEALLRAPGAEALATRLVLASESMQRLLQRRPGLLRWVHRSATTSAQLDADGAGEDTLPRSSAGVTPQDTEDLLRRLRRFKARQALRPAARDVWLGRGMETLGREQTALAEALLQAVLPALEAPLRQALRRARPGRLRRCSGWASSAARTSTGARTSTWCWSTAETA
jgi:glutamine synthetase adenylyltransferase